MSHVMGSIEVCTKQQTARPNVVEHAELVVLWGQRPGDPEEQLEHAGSRGQASKEAERERHPGHQHRSVYNETAKSGRRRVIAPERLHRRGPRCWGWPTPLQRRSTIRPSSIATPSASTNSSPICSAAMTVSRRAPTGEQRLRRRCQGDPPVGPSTWPPSAPMIKAGWGMQRQHHGEQPNRMLVTYCCHVGPDRHRGGGYGFSYHYLRVAQPHRQGRILAGIPPATR